MIPLKNICAMNPANMGNNNVETNLITVNFQPKMPISIGNLITIQHDHDVRNATVAPTPAPDFNITEAIGSVTRALPGAILPTTLPMKTPINPDSEPIHFAHHSGEISTCTIPAIIRANKSKGRT